MNAWPPPGTSFDWKPEPQKAAATFHVEPGPSGDYVVKSRPDADAAVQRLQRRLAHYLQQKART